MSSTALTAIAPLSSAWADGGNGGDGSTGTGGAGATGFGGPGGAGTGSSGGGGGGTGGGSGGASGSGAAGGGGGTAGSLDGHRGTDVINGAGGGGGGGFQALTTTSLENVSGTLTGGSGGAGGGGGTGGGGGGGAGGIGAISSGIGIQGNAEGASIVGGAGGAGGFGGGGRGGNGGDGGAAVQFTSFGVTLFINSGTITGGAGGSAGGSGPGGTGPGTAGAGGAGIVGTNMAIGNFGTITGGLSGDGVTRANAITFDGGAQNSLQITESSVIVGNVVATGTTNTLNFGGSGTIAFDMSTVGATAQYQGFNVLTKSTSNTWVLSGTTTATMAWQINGGAFAVAQDATLGAAANTLTFGSGGGLRWDASFNTARTVTLDSGGANLNTNGFDATMSGPIGGVGRLRKTGGGTLTLTGANTYQGGTAANGGTISVSADANLGAASGNIGFNGGTLQTTASFGTTRNVVLNGAGTVETVAGTTLTLGGTISNTGSLTKTGAGTLIVTNNNTYTGTTTVSAGVLQVGIGGTTGTLGSGAVTNNAQLTFNRSNDFTVANTIGGTGAVTKLGAGTLTLTGTNSYSGGTTVSAGTLAGTTASLQGAILNDANVRFDQATNGTYAGTMSGAGAVTVQGGGTVTFSGTNSYAGGTTVSGVGTTLVGTTASLQGAITNNAAVRFDQATNGTYAGNMSGTGSLAVQGGGTVTLSGTNAYAGGTTVSGVGTTLVGTTTSLQGNIANNATVVFGQAGNGTYAGTMSGSGGLTKTGAGTLTLTGINSYSGGTAINGGTVAISSDANLGVTGVPGAGVSMDGGTLRLLANGTTARIFTLNAGGGTIDTNGFDYQVQEIGGSGGLTKTGTGMLYLTLSSGYTGGTTVSGGTLQGDTSTLRGDIVNNASVVFFQTANGTYSGTMSGTGSLTVFNNSLTLTGTNTYSGGTTIRGTVATSRDDNLGAASGGITLNGGTLRSLASFSSSRAITLSDANGTPDSRFDTNGFTSTQNGDITGAGRLIKTGAGTLILGGTNSYTGGTTIEEGTLRGSTASLQGNIANAGQLVFDQATTGTYAGVISGRGTFEKIGAGTLILTGANTWTGSTTVSGGTLQGNATSLHGDITNNANLAFDQATDASYSGIISGSGSFTKLGAGTLTLTGTNHYSGGTTVSAGTLRGSVSSVRGDIVNNASVVFDQVGFGNYLGNMSGSGNLTLAAGWVFLAGTNSYTGGTTVNATTQLGGTTASLQGNIANSGIVSFDQSTDGTYAGVISGSGAVVKFGTGTVTLTGNNVFSGGLSLDGGVVAASSNANLGAAGGELYFQSGTLRFLTSFDIDRTIGIGDGGIGFGVIGAPTPRGAIFDTNGNNATLSGVIRGPDGLTKIGAGVLTLTAANTYAGGTTVTGGTLRLGAGGSLASGGALAVEDGTFDLDGHNQTVGALSGTGGTIALGTGTLTTDSSASTTLASTISGVGGSLVKAGTGTLTLTGANSYSGGTTVSGGILQGTTTSLQGNIVNNAVVAFSQAGTGTYAGNMSGSGGLLVNGTGTVILAGSNSYSGGTMVTGGILQGTTTSVQGNIVNNAQVTFNQATTGTYAGNMSGTGGLLVNGTGTVILGGSNSYSGGTMVTGGALQGTTTSLQGTIVNNATVAFNQAGSGTYAGSMSGSGAVSIGGGGTVIYTGSNTYSGGTSIAAGSTLQLGNGTAAGGSLAGNVVNNGLLVFNQPATASYGGVVSGSGGFTLQQGNLNVTGANTYTGPTTVNGGVLSVNGSLASTVTVNPGGQLGGNGTIGGLVSTGGTLAPGNSIGRLNVNGNFSQTGGTYVVEANPQGQADRVNVTGAATINGAIVQVLAASGSYANSTTYTILNASGGVTGTYSSVSSNFAFLTPSLSYNANNVFLTLALQGAAFSGFGGNTVNQRGVGAALDQSYASATGDFATVIGALAGLNTQQGPYTLNQISGQPYADFGTANLASNTLFMNALGQQMAIARGASGSGQRQTLAQACEVEVCDGASPFSVWGSALGGFGSVQGDGNSNTFTYNLGGAAAGIDYRVLPSLLLGIGAGYTSGTQWADTFQGKGWTNAVSVAAYVSYTMDGFYVDLLAGYAYSNNQLQRQISIPGLQPRTANGSTGANQFLGQAEIGYQVPVYAPAAASITPFARLQVMSVNQSAFNEWGANSLSLNVQQQTTNSVRSTLGAQLNGAIGLGDTRTLDLALRLGWLHEYSHTGRPITAALAGAPANAFTVYGATPQRDAAAIGFQASTAVAAGTQIYFRYDGDIGSGTDNHALNVGLRLSW